MIIKVKTSSLLAHNVYDCRNGDRMSISYCKVPIQRPQKEKETEGSLTV